MTPRQSMFFTILLAAMMTFLLVLAVLSPMDIMLHLASAAVIVTYLSGTALTVVLQKRHPESAWPLMRTFVLPSAAMGVMATLVAMMARHPELLK